MIQHPLVTEEKESFSAVVKIGAMVHLPRPKLSPRCDMANRIPKDPKQAT